MTTSSGLPIQAVITDWCGTMETNVMSRLKVIAQVCTDLDIPVPTKEQEQQISGMSQAQTIQLILGSRYQDENLRSRFTEIYEQEDNRDVNKLIIKPETTHWITTHLKFCLFTNGTRNYVLRNLDKYNLQHVFAAIATPDDFPEKPAPDMLIDLAKQMDVSCESCLVVGDHSYDLIAANGAGMPCAIVQTGTMSAHDFHDLPIKQPAAFCKDINEIPSLVQKMNSGHF